MSSHLLSSRLRRCHLAGAFAALLALAPATWAQPAPPPQPLPQGKDRVDLFFDDAALVRASLSPDGKWLARLTSPGNGGVMQLIVGDVEGKTQPKVVAQLTRARIDGFRWVGNDMLTLDVYESLRRGAVRRSPGLLSVRREDGTLRVLIKTD